MGKEERTAARPAPESTRPTPIRIRQIGFRRLRPTTKNLAADLGSPASIAERSKDAKAPEVSRFAGARVKKS